MYLFSSPRFPITETHAGPDPHRGRQHHQGKTEALSPIDFVSTQAQRARSQPWPDEHQFLSRGHFDAACKQAR